MSRAREIRWPDHLDGKRATVVACGELYRGTLRRTRVGWRMGDPVRGPGAAWYDSAMTAVDLDCPSSIGGRRIVAEFDDVESVPELDREVA